MSSPGSRSQALPLWYIGAEDFILKRLTLARDVILTPDLQEARCAVFQDRLPPPGPKLDKLKQLIRDGLGVVIILGEQVDKRSLALLTDGALQQQGVVRAPSGAGHAQALERLAAIIEYSGPPGDELARQINWKSAARIEERTLISVARGQVLVRTTKDDPVRPESPVLVRTRLGRGMIYVLTAWIRAGDQIRPRESYLEMLKSRPDVQNYGLQRWPYFNWLLYALTHTSAGLAVEPYAQWEASPVPHRREIRLMEVLLASGFAAFLLIYAMVRTYSRRHPEALLRLYLVPPKLVPPPDRSLAVELEAGADSATQGEPQTSASAPAARSRHLDARWEIVGFHRPLSGFLYNYLLALLVMIPFNFATTFYLERTFINPFPEARGAWAAVLQFMSFFFSIMDLGTGQAMVKYFAEYRVREPAKATSYAQFYIWFHALVGMIQIGLLGLGAAFLMPHTRAAFMTWYVILHTLVQFPGFILIFFNLFRALQRFDYAQLLILLIYVLTPVMQSVGGIYGRYWGLMHPVFGEGMGVVFGFALGGAASNLVIGVICGAFYHAVGYRLRTIFLAHFDRETIARSVKYGLKLTLGNALGALSWAATPIIMLALLPDFLELNEIWTLVFTLSYAYIETGAYIFTALMPTISESYSHGMRLLTRHYLDQGLRWGIMVTTMLGGAFAAFADTLILGLLPAQFARGAGVVWLMHLWRATDFATRLPDQVFQGVGRTGLFALAALVEHGSRILLCWWMIKEFGFRGLFYAFILSSVLKSLCAWPLMARYVISPAVSTWQTLINPLLAGFGNYLVMRAVVTLLWRGAGHPGSAWLAILLCLIGSLPCYMLLSGLLGWGEETWQEFSDAVDLIPRPFRLVAEIARAAIRFGLSVSPLHGRFPVVLAQTAAAEAGELTARKVPLE